MVTLPWPYCSFMSILNLIGSIATPGYPIMFLVESDILREASCHKNALFAGMVGSVKIDSSKFSPASFGVSSVDEHTEGLIMRKPPDAEDKGFTHYRSSGADRSARQRSSDSCHLKDLPRRFEGSESLEDPNCVVIPACSPLQLDDWQPIPYFNYMEHLLSCSVLAITGAISCFRPGYSTHAERAWTMAWLAFGILMGGSTDIVRRIFKRTQLWSKGITNRNFWWVIC